jgi:hypothetical protein
MKGFIKYIQQLINKQGYITLLYLWKHLSIYSELKEQLVSKKDPLSLKLPWITIEAKNFLLTHIRKNQSKKLRVFEYGGGGSTLFFLSLGCELYTVEHNSEWFNKVKTEVMKYKEFSNWHPDLAEPENADNSSNLQFDNPDHYSTLDENYKQNTFIKYVTSIDKYPDNFYDIILIDGRSRPSCIKHAASKVKKGGLLIIDNSERLYYYTYTQQYFKSFQAIMQSYGALVASKTPTQTDIYLKM